MNCNEIDSINEVSQINEVPMNPAAYGQSMEVAAEKGVMVGFEFEVCIPAEVVDNYNQKPGFQPEKDDFAWVGNASSVWWDFDIPGTFTDDLAITRQPFTANGKTYPVGTQLYTIGADWASSKVSAKIKSAFEALPFHTRKNVIKDWKQFIDSYPEYNSVYRFARHTKYNFKFNSPHRDIFSKILDAVETPNAIKKFWIETFGTTNLLQIVKNPALRWDTDMLKEELGVWDEDDYDEEDDYNGNFRKGAEMVQKELLKKYGKAIVFDDYHEQSKKLDTWYIEPDGSLEPNDEDYSCEIVSPPMLVNDAVAALKDFYTMAKSFEFYTSADNHTGLHINVSIPDKIDLLKLAVFAGDEHILKEWNRLDNSYANSVMQSLKSELYGGSNAYGIDSNVNLNKKSNIKNLLKIAKDISNDHMSSISMESGNKYISFRHVGGNYLANPTPVINVVGRFVRAMVIAANPAAYKKEYYSKLVKLVKSGQPVKPEITAVSQFMHLKKSPLSVVFTGMFGHNAAATPAKMLQSSYYKDVKDSYLSLVLPPATWGSIMPTLLATGKSIADSYDINREVLSGINRNTRNRALVVNLIGNDNPNYKTPRENTNRWRIPNFTEVSMRSTVAPGSPIHTLILNQLYAQLKQQHLKK